MLFQQIMANFHWIFAFAWDPPYRIIPFWPIVRYRIVWNSFRLRHISGKCNILVINYFRINGLISKQGSDYPDLPHAQQEDVLRWGDSGRSRAHRLQGQQGLQSALYPHPWKRKRTLDWTVWLDYSPIQQPPGHLWWKTSSCPVQHGN